MDSRSNCERSVIGSVPLSGWFGEHSGDTVESEPGLFEQSGAHDVEQQRDAKLERVKWSDDLRRGSKRHVDERAGSRYQFKQHVVHSQPERGEAL